MNSVFPFSPLEPPNYLTLNQTIQIQPSGILLLKSGPWTSDNLKKTRAGKQSRLVSSILADLEYGIKMNLKTRNVQFSYLHLTQGIPIPNLPPILNPDPTPHPQPTQPHPYPNFFVFYFPPPQPH